MYSGNTNSVPHKALSLEKCLAPGDFPGGPATKNLSSNAGDAGSIPGRGAKIPHVMGQLSLHRN